MRKLDFKEFMLVMIFWELVALAFIITGAY